MSVAALLLAAGRSTRFGVTDKMTVLFEGVPLGLHAARTLLDVPFAARFVVTNTVLLDWSGWEIVPNDQPEMGLGRSIALGTVAARRSGATALLIALADMPLVPASHFERLLACHRGPGSRAASSDGRHRMPPALFGSDWFDALEGLSGDHGARALLADAETVPIAPFHLIDIDRPQDLARARAKPEMD